MNGIGTDTLLIFLLGVLPSVILGYLIAVQQKRHLIAGWDESKVANPKAFAKLLGGSILFLGIGLGFIAIGKECGFMSDLQYVTALLVLTFIPILCLIIAKKKYGKTPG